MRKVFLLAFLVCALPLFAQAQFNSGSTGADGALDLSTMTCPDNVCYVQLPESGILNYTTVNIPQGKELRFRFNSRNTPVIMLLQNTINISGIINISGNGRVPGSGGFYGGANGSNGFGPGGGQLTCATRNGRWVGSLSLIPIIGGSGSGNVGGCHQFDNGETGGGGGAILIASSTLINLTALGRILAEGACSTNNCGSGGAIRLVANSVNIAGNLSAISIGYSSNGNPGIIRIEAPAGNRNITGTVSPMPVISEINPIIIPINPPNLTIASIGSYAVPSYSAGRPDRVDLLLPTQLTDPVSIVIQGNNVPSGTQVRLQLSSSSGTATECTLTGGPGPVSCTASVSGLNRSGVSTLLAVAVFTPPAVAEKFNPKGGNYVARVKLETALGGKPKYVFLRTDGTSVETKNLSAQFLQQFGM